MRAVVLLILGSLVCAPACAGVWTNLWRTPDQQGEALLAAGQPAKAAERFSNPRLKAYADLRAGHYGAAARLLAPLKDPTSEYNRGNALARLGHLHQALAAYDAALKQTPHDADIRHNRDLVERMLAHHRRPRARKPGHGGAKRHASGTSRGKQGHGAHGAGKGQRSDKSGAKGRGSSRQQGHSGGTGTAAGAPGSRSAQARGTTGTGAHREQATRASGQSGERAGARRRTPGQARRDAARAAALARREAEHGHSHPVQAGRANGSHRAAHSLVARTAGMRSRPPKPVSEKTLALRQWLRQLPNNPAGLLRREFLIKYMMRHRGTEP